VKKMAGGEWTGIREEFMKLLGRLIQEICREEGASWWKVYYM